MAVLGFASLTANACRIVGIGFLALSKPVQPHQKRRSTQHSRPRRAPLNLVATAAVHHGPSPICAFGGAGGSRTRVQHPSTSACRAFAHTIVFTAGRRKPLVFLLSGVAAAPAFGVPAVRGKAIQPPLQKAKSPAIAGLEIQEAPLPTASSKAATCFTSAQSAEIRGATDSAIHAFPGAIMDYL